MNVVWSEKNREKKWDAACFPERVLCVSGGRVSPSCSNGIKPGSSQLWIYIEYTLAESSLNVLFCKPRSSETGSARSSTNRRTTKDLWRNLASIIGRVSRVTIYRFTGLDKFSRVAATSNEFTNEIDRVFRVNFTNYECRWFSSEICLRERICFVRIRRIRRMWNLSLLQLWPIF